MQQIICDRCKSLIKLRKDRISVGIVDVTEGSKMYDLCENCKKQFDSFMKDYEEIHERSDKE